MESLFKLPMASGARVRILQITDTHLFAGEHETLLGVNTFHSYRAVLDAIIAEQHPFDLVVATGDLASGPLCRRLSEFCEGNISPACALRLAAR